MNSKTVRFIRALILYLLLAFLLWWSLRAVPIFDIWMTLKVLHLWQIAILLFINAFVILAMAARWWVILRADNQGIPFWKLVRYRLAVFGMSYFTPGPQVGGEPLQVIYLQKGHGVTFARASAAVIIDKLLEFLANFILLGAGLVAAIRVGLVSRSSPQSFGSLIPLVMILFWPLIHLVMLYQGSYPVSFVLHRFLSRFERQKWMRIAIVSERMAASFTHRHPRSLMAALGFSLLSWAGMAAEYFLMADFLHVVLSPEQTLAALTTALFAFLMPLPGGLGALEASQVYVLTTFGHPGAIGIGISLLMRARDIFNGGMGLFLAGGDFRVK